VTRLVAPASAAPRPPQRSLGLDSVVTSGSKILVGLMNFAAAVVVARQLGPEGRGSVAVALTLVLLLMQVANVGVATANPYFVARHPEETGRLVANTIAWSLAVGASLGALLVVVRAVLPGVLAGMPMPLVVVSALAVPCGLASVLLQSILLGEGRVSAYNGVEALWAVAAVLLLLVVGALVRLSPTGALLVLAAQYPAASLTYLALLRRGIEPPRLDRALAVRVLRFGARVYLPTVLAFLVIRLDLLLVNSLLGRTQAGLYSVAVVIAQGLIVIPAAIATNLLPRVARGRLVDFSARVFRVVAVLYGALCLAVALAAWPLVHWFFGARFGASLPMVLWLMPGTYALGMLSILSFHFAGSGYPRRATWIWAAGVVLNVALNLLLLPPYGTVVASITSTVTYVLMLGLHVRLFSGIDPPAPSLRPDLGEAWRVLAGIRRSP
jgi:O-antigen/teichoic acid export membrane protein